jgi:PAS domain S-box-containing protein
MSQVPSTSPRTPRAPGKLDNEESQLWRWILLFMVLLAAGFAALAWERLESLPYHLGPVAVGVLVLSVLLAVYAYGRRKEVVELKMLLQDLQEHVGAAPSEDQLDQLNELIARSQRSFKELIDSLEDAACAASLDGTLRTVNKTVSDLLGLPYTAIVGQKVFDFLEEPSRSSVEAGVVRFLEKRHWTGMVRVRLKNNSRTLYFDCVLNAIIKSGEVVGVSALARNVTGQHEKELRFTELFETLQEGAYFSTPEGRLLDANPALISILGYASKEELLALEPKALNSDPSQPPVLGRAADDRGAVRAREITLRRKDGRSAVFLESSRAVWDEAGKLIRYQGTLVDVTERRMLERQLLQQEEFRRSLLEGFPDLILVFDLEERHTFVSSRVRDLLGYQAEDLLGKKLSESQDHCPELVTLYHEVVSGSKFGSAEFSVRHKDGTVRTMRASASQFFDADSTLAGVIVSVRDISTEKKLEQQVVQSERLAAMGAMIGGVAHELNNPLTSILGVSELLQDSQTNDADRKHITILQQQARRAAEIVHNLTYFATPPTPGKTRVQLADIVERTLNLHAYSLRKNNITVDFVRDPGLPYALGDPHQIMQVFLNLILNAEQAIREQRDRGTLRIRLGSTGQSVWASFLDDGPGVPPEILASIFDPFYTTKRPGRGTGLGLSICKSIVKEHNGLIEAANAPGGGAAFTVTLPAATSTSAISSPAAS